MLDGDGDLVDVGDEPVDPRAGAPAALLDQLNGLCHRLVVGTDEDGLLGLTEQIVLGLDSNGKSKSFCLARAPQVLVIFWQDVEHSGLTRP